MAMKTYIIHATVRYVLHNRTSGEPYSAQSRPTLSIDATSEGTALRRARKQEKARLETDCWKVSSLSVIPELVKVIEHPTPAQRRVLVRLYTGKPSGTNKAMLYRLVDKGWLEGSTKDGYRLTAAGRREIG